MPLLSAVLRLAARMPLAALHFFGTGLGWLVYWASPTYRHRLRENLRIAGYGDAPIRHAAIAEAGKGLAELPRIWFGRDDPDTLVHCGDWAVAEAALAEGRGLIFLTPHLGCFEISALYGARRLPLTVLYRPPKRAGRHPARPGARRGRGRVGGFFRPAGLYHDPCRPPAAIHRRCGGDGLR
jgi:KDO2-lipid IV(A) lauroyltransferase